MRAASAGTPAGRRLLRRKVYRDLVADGSLGPGYATEDGVGLHYVGAALSRVVTIRPAACAWWVEPDGRGGYREERLPADVICPGDI